MRTRTTGKAIAVTVLILTACSSAMAQAPELRASRSKVIALEHAWNQAEERKDVNALDQIMDDSLVYTDYDGTLMSKADFLASVKAPARHPEQNLTESMDAQVYGDGAVVIGVYRVKGTVNGKPYLRRGRFTDTWIKRNGSWLCVASQNTLISH
jgi:ketosteroid isomerase-like protein